jgi:hypothetical protein
MSQALLITVFPRALTVVKRPLKSAGNSLLSPLKQASSPPLYKEEKNPNPMETMKMKEGFTQN